jgi:hypothetical protein
MNWILWIAVVALVITSAGQIISRDWRMSMVLLVVQYFAVFWLIQIHWPLTMAGAKLITGWMSIAIVSMTQVNFDRESSGDTSWPEGGLFRLFTTALIAIAAFTIAPGMLTFLPGITLPEAIGGTLLIAMGMLHLGITAQPLRVIFGLLTALAGFEILYAAIENAVLIAALLAVINLSLAIIGAYLLNAASNEKIT